MPKYNSAAEVRAAHPGAYDDLSDQQIEAGLAKQNGGSPGVDPQTEMRHATSGDDYTSAFMGELGRTGKEALKGLAQSPMSAIKGLLGMPGAAVKGLVHDLPQLVADPSLLKEAPRAVGEAVTDLGNHPRDAGDLLGQMVLGKVAGPKLPGAANAVLREGPGVVGRGISAVGSGLEAAGASKAMRGASKLGAVGSAMHGNIPGVALALAPDALEMTGRGLQRGGAAMQGLDLSFKGGPEVTTVPESRRLGPARVSTEIPDHGQSMDNASGSWEPSSNARTSPDIRGSQGLSGLEDAIDGRNAKLKDAAFGNTRNDPNYDAKVNALRARMSGPEYEASVDSTRQKMDENKWAGDKSAQPEAVTPWDAGGVTEDTYRASRPLTNPSVSALESLIEETQRGHRGPRPIDTFLENDPQARIGGEGRMTGQFEEGSGGLADVAAGKIKPYDSPSSTTPDARHAELLDLLGGQDVSTMSGEEASALFNKRFGLKPRP